jgi:release factor H-coupled RctB family protein
LALAKNKLRLKKAKTLYLNHGIEFTDPTYLGNGKIAKDRYDDGAQ